MIDWIRNTPSISIDQQAYLTYGAHNFDSVRDGGLSSVATLMTMTMMMTGYTARHTPVT